MKDHNKSNLMAASVPNISEDFLRQVTDAFRPMEINPLSTIEEIMFNAGAQEVIRWLHSKAERSIITGGTLDRSGSL